MRDHTDPRVPSRKENRMSALYTWIWNLLKRNPVESGGASLTDDG